MAESLFKWKHFESDIVLLCVRWYRKYPLSYRNLSDMMKEGGLWTHTVQPLISASLRIEIRLQPNGFSRRRQVSGHVQHRMTDYLNNIVEQDHRFIKKIVKPMVGFHSFKSACANLSGIEVMPPGYLLIPSPNKRIACTNFFGSRTYAIRICFIPYS